MPREISIFGWLLSRRGQFRTEDRRLTFAWKDVMIGNRGVGIKY